MIWERMVAFTPNDRQQAVPAYSTIRTSNSSAATAVQATLTNASSLPIELAHIGLRALAGTAQTTTEMHVDLRKPDDSINLYLFGDSVAGAGGPGIGKVIGSRLEGVIWPPLWRIVATGNFSAGANANQIELVVIGWAIPRGSIHF